MSGSISLYCFATLVTVSVALYFYVKCQSRQPLPPGPGKLPLLGNLFNSPTKFEWETYQAWAEEFKSDVIHINMAGTDIVVLDSAEAAYDLLERKSAIYSSRPGMPMVNELMGWDWAITTMAYNDRWLEQRKLAQQEFSPLCTPRYYPQQRTATHELLRHLSKTPEDFVQHVRHMAGHIILSVAYGIDILPSNDPYIDCAEKAMASVTVAMVPGTFLVDSVPILKYVPSWLPGAGFQRKAKEWRKLSFEMASFPFNAVKAAMAQGSARPSFTSTCLQAIDENGDIPHQEDIIRGVAGALYGGGADTTVSAICTFILAMVLYPEVQREAQRELDSCLGQGNLPDFGDEPALPYISAIMKEVLRWRPVLPMCVPHLLQAEDTYKGYRIPAGTICIPNVWSMLHNKVTYPDPSKFKPERFMKDGKLDPEVKDPNAAFGFGRRICPGRFTAQSSLWIAIASILSCFHISKAVDENGSTIEPTGKYVSSLISHPLPFKCAIKPRSVDAMNLIMSTVE